MHNTYIQTYRYKDVMHFHHPMIDSSDGLEVGGLPSVNSLAIEAGISAYMLNREISANYYKDIKIQQNIVATRSKLTGI